jgi:hypothetical protein
MHFLYILIADFFLNSTYSLSYSLNIPYIAVFAILIVSSFSNCTLSYHERVLQLHMEEVSRHLALSICTSMSLLHKVARFSSSVQFQSHALDVNDAIKELMLVTNDLYRINTLNAVTRTVTTEFEQIAPRTLARVADVPSMINPRSTVTRPF